MNEKIKILGQVYTPKSIVNDMLDLLGYNSDKILGKHIIDNSCGDGAFLTEIVERYIKEYKRKNNSLLDIEKDLATYIHGVEIDRSEYLKCIDNLNSVASCNGVGNVNWDVICADTLTIDKYDNKMDFVVANPPYVRTHNLQDNFEKVREFSFAKNGMTDLFIVFYEIGFNMLNESGKLVYITPNSFYSSVAGQEFRNYIVSNGQLYSLVDLGHYQPFKATAYTTICAFDKNKKSNEFNYSTYSKEGKIEFQEKLIIKEAFNNGKMVLAKKREQKILKDIQNYIPTNKDLVQVKNGFATLADTVFIKKEFSFASRFIIDVLKASTGEWKKCIFPYDKDKAVSFDSLENELREHLVANKKILEGRSLDKNAEWFAFGRSQAVKDVYKNKIAINTTIKNVASVKLQVVASGQGIYSGLYILTGKRFEDVERVIKHQNFIDYISTIGKCKSGGYYTFSSNDLKQYLLYKLEGANE